MTKSNSQIETNKYLSKCDSKDVIAIGSKVVFRLQQMYDLLLSALDARVINVLIHSINQKLEHKCNSKQWFEDGESCEILKADSSGWKKGKLKLKVNLTLEFIPDEPELEQSPLDDVRQEMNLNKTTN